MASNLPVVQPRVFDFSTLSTFNQCPRMAYYRYWLGRDSVEPSFPLTFGSAYHLYREVLEKLYIENGRTDDPKEWEKYHQLAFAVASDGWVDPPLGHKKEFLTVVRLAATCEQAFAGWKQEKLEGRMVVVATEEAFELQLPSGIVFGGKKDQVVEWNGAAWVRDFKTTSYMGRTYANKFDPNAQITGYVWATMELSGRRVAGAIIETIYNTKTKGPEHHSFLSTRSQFHIDEWMKDIAAAHSEIERAEAQGYFPKRTSSCDMYGGCIFRTCCSMSSPAAREEWLNNHTVERRWDFAAKETD
jgi:hypothetical protein